MEAYTTTKIVLKDVVDPSRIFYRDNRSYFNILLDDNIRKWIMRIYTVNNKFKLQFNDTEHTTVEISTPLDIIQYSDNLSATVKKFLENK